MVGASRRIVRTILGTRLAVKILRTGTASMPFLNGCGPVSSMVPASCSLQKVSLLASIWTIA